MLQLPFHLLQSCSSSFLARLAILCFLPMGALQAQALRLMPMGDSITEGISACSYRTPLVQSLSSCNVQFVGSKTSPINPPANCTTSNFNHEGHSGWNTINFLDTHPGGSGLSNLRYFVDAELPDVVLLHVGSNDMNQPKVPGTYDVNTSSGTGTIGRIDEMVDEIYTEVPGATIFVGDMIPWYASSSVNDKIDLLRIEIYTMVADRAADGDEIYVVDVNDGFIPSMMQADGKHPNATGDSHMAGKWLAALQSQNFCSGGGTIYTVREEAESGTLVGTMAVGGDSNASGSAYVSVPGSGSSLALQDYVDIDYTLTETGAYRMLARVLAPNTAANSFFVELGVSDNWLWDIPATGDYTNSYVSDRTTGQVTVYLTAGTHTVRVFRREDDARLDWLELDYLGADPNGDADGDGTPNNSDSFPNDSSQSAADNTPPNTTLDNPGTPAPGLVTLSGTASDSGSGVDKVMVRVRRSSDGLYWNGSSWVTSTNSWLEASGDTSWSLGVTLSAAGSYRAWAYAVDEAGNIESWADGRPQIDFIVGSVDSTPPNTTLDNPGTPAPGLVTLSGTASDSESGVDKVMVRVRRSSDGLYWNGSSWVTSTNTWLEASGDTSWSLGVTLSAAGSYRAWAYAVDEAGNIESWADGRPQIDFIVGSVDSTPPNTTLDNPGTPAPGLVTLSGTASDSGSGVDKVMVRVRRSSDGLYWNGSSWVTSTNSWLEASGDTSWSLGVTLSAAGSYRAWAYAVDEAGNVESWADGRPQIDFIVGSVDSTPPNTTLDDPGTPAPGLVTLSGTASDSESGVDKVMVRVRRSSDGLYWNGSSWVTSTNSWLEASGDTSWSLGVTLSAAGSYRAWAYAVDEAGNVESWADGRPQIDFSVQ